MSTIGYSALTTARDDSTTGSDNSRMTPGVKTYVDALAALVPAEVLTMHAAILPVTTEIKDGTTKITAPETLQWTFWGLLVIAVGLYAVPRLVAKKWNKLDWYRSAIPPLAFVGWTMLQRSTAFDAISSLDQAPRTVIALFLGVILGLLATLLAYKPKHDGG